MDIEIRMSRRGDLNQLTEMDNLLWDKTTAPVSFHWRSAEEYSEKHPPGSQIVAVSGERVCGYAGFRTPTGLPRNNHVVEFDIAVHPDCRRMGVGRRLIDAVREYAAAKGFRKLSLRVLASNAAALAFYRKCGFIEQGRLVEEFELDGGYVDDILMYMMLDGGMPVERGWKMENDELFTELNTINEKPAPFEFYTARDLWTDEHISSKMLEYHLNPSVDAASRKTGFIDRSADWITRHFHLGPGSDVLDLGCGPGLYTNRFSAAGMGVTGVDFSLPSIEYARKTAAARNLSVEYINGNYFYFETIRRFDLVTMIMCDYCALSPGQRKTILGKVRSFLKPGGRFLFDVYSMEFFRQREERLDYAFNYMDHFWSSDDYYCFLNVFRYPEDALLLDKYTVIEKQRRRKIYNWMQCFSPEALEKELAAEGFGIDGLFADVAGTEYTAGGTEFAVAAAAEKEE